QAHSFCRDVSAPPVTTLAPISRVFTRLCVAVLPHVRRKNPRTYATTGGLRLLANRKLGTGDFGLPGWLRKYGEGRKRLPPHCRSLGNRLLSGCPHGGGVSPPVGAVSCGTPFGFPSLAPVGCRGYIFRGYEPSVSATQR